MIKTPLSINGRSGAITELAIYMTDHSIPINLYKRKLLRMGRFITVTDWGEYRCRLKGS